MGALVRNLYLVKGRWKFRKSIPERLRPCVDGRLTEFVRWLGPSGGLAQPAPEILRKYASTAAECAALIEMAEKRAAGRFDRLTPDVVAHLISKWRSDLLAEDEEDRFDASEDAVYEAIRAQIGAAPGDPDRRWNKRQESLEVSLDIWRHEYSRGRISDFVTDELIDRCAGEGLRIDPVSDSFHNLVRSYLALLIQTGEASLRRQTGDAIPTPDPPAPLPREQLLGTPSQTLTGLVEAWWIEGRAAGKAQSTYEAYERAARQLAAFVGHDDANAVTPDDVVRFKEHRLASGVSLKTVKDGDLSGLRALFRWGVGQRRVRSNPAEGITTQRTTRHQSRPKGFTDDEAQQLLSHASHHRQSLREGAKMADAKRWVPWLCAYTGARLGEMVQLRGQDVFQQAGRWVIHLNPEAVTIKGGSFRTVPLHLHLVEMGFPDLAKAAGDEFIFMSPRDGSDGAERGAWRTVKNRVTEHVRQSVTDKRVQPNHAWRHRFETVARNLGVREDVTNAITGHTTPGVAADYGDTEIIAMGRIIDQLPAYPAEPPPRPGVDPSEQAGTVQRRGRPANRRVGQSRKRTAAQN